MLPSPKIDFYWNWQIYVQTNNYSASPTKVPAKYTEYVQSFQ